MSTNFSPTPAELTLVSQIFAQADPQKLGVLTGDVAVRVFSGAKLPPASLGEIWNIADDGNNGWLSKKGVAMAVRLIGWAQKGEAITAASLNKPGPLAVIEGVSIVSRQSTGLSSPRSPPPVSFPPLGPQDKTKFQNMFIKSGPVNGLLSGEQARDIFVKSKLGTDQLMKIWNLADTQDRGALDATDFAIGMYFIQGLMTNKISTIPNALPPGLYQQAGGGLPSVRSHVTGNSGSFSPVSSVFAAQHTGQSDVFAQRIQPNHTGMSSAFKPALPARPSILSNSNGPSNDWDVTPTEKTSADRYFDTLDTHKLGYIEGEVAVPFMLKSQLPGETLALIWDLADINNDGKLTRDGFAIAMHLIQKKLSGQEVPSTLPVSLIPPHLRGQQFGSSPFSPANSQFAPHPEPQVDLFSFDDPPPSSIPAQTTGTAFGSPAKNKAVEHDPFSSSPFQPNTRARSPTTDFFGDDEPAGSPPPAHDRSAEIGNVKNQLQSTTRSLETAKIERASIEQTLANQASQLSTLQTQLSSAKAAYETETSLLTTFKERYTQQTAEINQAREQLIRAESDLSAVRVEKAEIEGAFLRDKEEVRELHRNMIEVGKQAEALKQDVEKLKKEAKQQKGLLAIARKQLSTKEAEKAKAEKEHEDAVAELTTVTQEKETVEADTAHVEAEINSIVSSPRAPKTQTSLSPSESLAFAAAQPLPSTPAMENQIPTPMKSNNPFERLAMSSVSVPVSPRSQSPFSMTSSPPPVNDVPKAPSVMFFESNEDFMEPPVKLEVSSPPDAAPSTKDKEEADTELSYLSDDAGPQTVEGVLSPNTELFMTPPTSANPESSPASNPADKFPSLDDLSASLDKEAVSEPKEPVAKPKRKSTVGETDLNASLKEIEVEESDSDADSDDDETQEEVTKPSVPAASTAAPLPTKQVEEPVKVPSAPSKFDDIFGDSEPTNGHAVPPTTTTTAPSKDSFDFSRPTLENTKHDSTLAGVNAFDETLGGISGSALPAQVSFNAFEDEFDFGKFNLDQAKAAAAEKDTNDVSFDDIFGGTSLASGPSQPSPPKIENGIGGTSISGTKAKTNGGSDFDDVFGIAVSTPQPEAQKLPVAAPAPAQEGRPTPSTSPEPTSSGFSNTSSVMTPRLASSVSSKPDMPTRQTSPPPRTLSPKPSRPSFSSSKEVHEKAKEPPPTRHSKLSIRLPFGKKKKQQQQEPLPQAPSQHLSPPIEEPRRIGTPASEDDVEAVKQLSAMGFSRGQAVEALEKYGYDVQRALNSLLK